MATTVIMPRQGQSVESCILTSIVKKKGDAVSPGDVLFAYETDKSAFEEEARMEGVVIEVFFEEGDEVPVLSPVMVVGATGEAGTAGTVGTPTACSATQKVSPRARALAERFGVDAGALIGSGPGGRVVESDVKAARRVPRSEDRISTTPSASQTPLLSKEGNFPRANNGSGEESTIVPLTNIRKLIAQAMHASLANSAQLTHHLSADARRMLELRRQAKTDGRNLTINDFVCYAVVRALGQFPAVNAHFLGESEGVRRFAGVHLALAVDTERGLMVPVVRSADRMTIGELATALKQVAEACRRGSVNPDLLAPEAASFTVSNLGGYGVEMFTPIINLPQVAILGVNTIVPRPKELGDGVYGFVPHIGLSLTYDHRAIDGGEATRFLRQIAMEIENLNHL